MAGRYRTPFKVAHSRISTQINKGHTIPNDGKALLCLLVTTNKLEKVLILD
jgi:hypothetical protein